MKKQLLRILLVACLLVVLLPTAAMAAGTGYILIGGTEGFSGEGPGNLVDGNINTKWCLQHNQMSWVIFKTPDAMRVTGYAITTGNDNAENHGRNPKSWTLYGSTEALDSSNSQWEAIVNVGSDTTLQDKNSTTYYFDLDSQTEKAYQNGYRWNSYRGATDKNGAMNQSYFDAYMSGIASNLRNGNTDSAKASAQQIVNSLSDEQYAKMKSVFAAHGISIG